MDPDQVGSETSHNFSTKMLNLNMQLPFFHRSLGFYLWLLRLEDVEKVLTDVDQEMQILLGSIQPETAQSVILFKKISAGDPDPLVLGPPGSGFVCQRYGSGYLKKTLIPTVRCLLYDFLS